MERFRRLQKSNQDLGKAHADAEREIDRQTVMIKTYQKEKTVQKVQFAGQIEKKQLELEAIEVQNQQILATNEENKSRKLARTCEHGQMLMTISNIYYRCWFYFQNLLTMQRDIKLPTNFDNIDDAFLNEHTYKQLETINDMVKNFKVVMQRVAQEDKSMGVYLPHSLQHKQGRKA